MQSLGNSVQWLASTSAIVSRRALSSSSAPFPIIRSVAEVRTWRRDAAERGHRVGFVATMGALHDGHVELVRHSLRDCDKTIVSIFVNPAYASYLAELTSRLTLTSQFAPHEDLSTYPRPIEADLAKLSGVKEDSRAVSAVFLPPVEAMYPTGVQQDVNQQRGTFVEVKGFSHQMEGGSRPTFFRGVATVVCKLFNIVQPDRTFFGQKDVQQCVVLRQMIRDLHLPHPPSPKDLVVVPTVREEGTGLAMSSRNTYLSAEDRQFAPLLHQALRAAEAAYFEQRARDANASIDGALLLGAAREVIKAAPAGKVRLDYIALNDPHTLAPLERIGSGRGALLSGAMVVGRTRLIDNLLLDHDF